MPLGVGPFLFFGMEGSGSMLSEQVDRTLAKDIEVCCTALYTNNRMLEQTVLRSNHGCYSSCLVFTRTVITD
ncbi:hypothetical protein EJ08DRAFT_257943 [Tothia fuscella]|uniref:Uncharacterized protein n=1 Tax=Tothia fuscella TaxID=1048955 RepID=A0A9P4TXW7_9PEZI|nr:hypothetical protein EJ08DRAFT_257943 [Tothia fuscella]